VEPAQGQAAVLIPATTTIGGEAVRAIGVESFAQDMRQIGQTAQRNADAWSQLAQESARLSQESTRRSLDFYSQLSFNSLTQAQVGDTSANQTVNPNRTAVGDKQLVSTPSAMSGVDNANLNSAQGGTLNNNAVLATVSQYLAANLPGLVAAAVSNALAPQVKS
jgi:hypothetical protein